MSETPTYMVRHYQLLDQLSDDEITIFKAQDTQNNKAVLIKFFLPLKPHAKEFLAHFEETAAGLVKLQHPNLEPVLDYGFQEGVPYLVTPFSGQTLASIKNKPPGLDAGCPSVDPAGQSSGLSAPEWFCSSEY